SHHEAAKDLFLSEKDLRAFVPYLALVHFTASTGESPRRRDEKPQRSREGFVSLKDLRPSCHISLWFTSQRRRANHHEGATKSHHEAAKDLFLLEKDLRAFVPHSL